MTTFQPYDQGAVCVVCDAALRITADLTVNEWRWMDAHGQTTGLDPDLIGLGSRHPWHRLAELDAVRRTDRAAQAEFEALTVRLSTGGTRHVHVPGYIPPYVGPPVPGQCCGTPPRLTPGGWRCGVCHAALTSPGTTEEAQS